MAENLKDKLKKKTKILAVSDIHGDTGLVKKLADKAEREKVDLVILAGDITILDNPIKGIVGPFVEKKKKVLLLHGNHESISTIDSIAELYSETKNLHGYSLKHNNVGIFGVGGADFGHDSMSEKDFRENLERAHNYIKDFEKKVLVSHMHPAGTKSEFSGVEGSLSIRKSIEYFQPDVAIFGHIHEASGFEEKIGKTRVINISRKEIIVEI